jgi:NADH-quinone oxidoreductase subunit E
MSDVVSQAEISRAMKKVQKELPPEKSSLIPGLQKIQSELGYLPKQAMKDLAGYINIREAEIWGAASFYAQFRFTPVGRHKITVCRGTACHVRGSAGILREMERELGIKAGETTDDLMFSLETVACLGSCALAPVMVINNRVHGTMNTTKANTLLESLKREQKSSRKKAPKRKTKRVN